MFWYQFRCASCLLLDLPDPVHGATKPPTISFVPVSRYLSRETTSEQVQAPLRSSTVECTHRSDSSQDKILSPTEPIPNNHRFSVPSQIHSVLQTTITQPLTPPTDSQNSQTTTQPAYHNSHSKPPKNFRLLSTQD